MGGMMTRQEIIAAVEAFSATHNLAPATVTGRAVGNSRLYDRMKAGGDCTLDIATRLLGYMNEHSKTSGANAPSPSEGVS